MTLTYNFLLQDVVQRNVIRQVIVVGSNCLFLQFENSSRSSLTVFLPKKNYNKTQDNKKRTRKKLPAFFLKKNHKTFRSSRGNA